MINWLIEMDIPFTVVCTKTDKLSKNQLNTALNELNEKYFSEAGIDILPFSSITRAGKEELWKKIFDSID
jgi:GTP-binding protein